ncbi:hypothetical protein C5C55_07810 [Rathayibacter sp. AY1C2]|nr:hypothetical protein C5C55_07810 [Rathayibacter sp. AY1C2]PPH52054.1 hypothetical protein C5C67_10410 [Rathayibacter sp. AY1E1]
MSVAPARMAEPRGGPMTGSAYEDFDYEGELPIVWRRALPWLEGHATADRAVLRSVLAEADPSDPSARSAVVEHIVEHRSASTMGELFPSVRVRGLPERIDSVRLANVLLREGLVDFEALAPMRVRGLMVVRGMGARSLTDLLSWYVGEALRTGEDRAAPLAEQSPPSRRSRQAAEATPRTRLLDALHLASAWNEALGLSDEPLLAGSRDTANAPAEVVEAWSLLDSLTSAEWSGGAPAATLAEQLGVHLSELDDRQRVILLERHTAGRRATLDVLGERFGVTRERVRQLEVRLRAALPLWLERDQALAFRASAVRARIGALSHLDGLSDVPGLLDEIDDDGTSALAVLDAVDDGFEGDGAWFAAPSLGAARAETAVRFADLVDPHGGATHAEVLASFAEWTSLSEKRVVEWMAMLGHVRIGDVWTSSRRRSIGDLAVVLLSSEGEPRSVDWIEAAFEGEREVRSIRNALAADARLVRVGRDDWALAEWGGEAYTSIKDAIAAEVRRNDGAVALDALLEDLPERFSISANSIRTYAGGWPFVVQAGVVRFAERRAVVRTKPGMTRNLYFLDEGRIAFRIDVTGEHLRGSGTMLSSGVALALGVAPGETRQWSGDGWGLTITWARTQPMMSTLRAGLATIDSAAGDSVRLVFDGEHVTVAGIERPDDLLAVMGITTADSSTMARAVGLPEEASREELEARLEDRGEGELASGLAEAGLG